MRYFMVSDIHGEYDKLVSALKKNGFDQDKDTLVSVGDAFDRGPKNTEVLNYLVNLPNKILLFGNHCMRLQNLVEGTAHAQMYDGYNKTIYTIEEFGGVEYDYEQAIKNINKRDTDISKNLFKYFELCHYAIEFPELYITHAWLPFNGSEFTNITLKKNWKKIKDRKQWYEATWANTEQCIDCDAFPDKPLLVGHWHAWRIAEHFGEFRGKQVNDLNTSTYILPNKLIAIDGCTTIQTGQVNVYIYETDAEPIIY